MLQFLAATLVISVTNSVDIASPPAITHNPNPSNGDVAWEHISGNIYATTLVFDATELIIDQDGGSYATMVIRLHNDSLPSPTLRFERGNQYQVTLINNLEPESDLNPTTEINGFKDPNTTNIHTHGLHISGQYPSDYVFTKVEPGQSHTYIYNIPCDHAGGMHWYHPHHHGSITLQVGSGCAGASIIEWDQQAENLPDWLINMRELVLVIQYFSFGFLNNIFDDTVDYLTSFTNTAARGSTPSSKFYLANGVFNGTIQLTAGEWTLLRMLYIDTDDYARITITDDTDSSIDANPCDLRLIARDGVLVRGLYDTDCPRDVSGSDIFLAPASRADIAIHCPGDGVNGVKYYSMTSVNADDAGTVYLIAKIVVSGTESSPNSDLAQFTPVRPGYLSRDLVNYNGEYQQYSETRGSRTFWYDSWEVEITGVDINRVPFEGEGHYLKNVSVGMVNQWNVTNYMGTGYHPMHVHVNHFQVVSLGDQKVNESIPYGWFEIGDYYDTLYGPGIIRFVTDTFGGVILLHCHILRHEDDGGMATIQVQGGCDYDYTDLANGPDGCDYDATSLCSTNTNNQTPQPTITTVATTSGSAPGTDSPTNRPTTPVPSTSPTNMPTIANIIVTKMNDIDSSNRVKLCLNDVLSSVSVSSVKISDDNSNWVSHKSTEIMDGCDSDTYVLKRRRGTWSVPLHLRLQANTGETLTVYDLITSWDEGLSYDFGDNFDPSYASFADSSKTNNTVIYTVIGVSCLVILILVLIYFGYYFSNKRRMKDDRIADDIVNGKTNNNGGNGRTNDSVVNNSNNNVDDMTTIVERTPIKAADVMSPQFGAPPNNVNVVNVAGSIANEESDDDMNGIEITFAKYSNNVHSRVNQV